MNMAKWKITRQVNMKHNYADAVVICITVGSDSPAEAQLERFRLWKRPLPRNNELSSAYKRDEDANAKHVRHISHRNRLSIMCDGNYPLEPIMYFYQTCTSSIGTSDTTDIGHGALR